MAARSEGEGAVAGDAARQGRRGRDDGETRPQEQVFSGVESLAPDEAALPRGDERAV